MWSNPSICQVIAALAGIIAVMLVILLLTIIEKMSRKQVSEEEMSIPRIPSGNVKGREYFREKKTIKFNRPEVWIFAFFSILIVHSLVYIISFIHFYPQEISKNEFFWISVVFFAGLFVSSFFYFYYKAEHNKFLKHAPGYREIEDQDSPKK
jgi:magnesium-transporting ATPase (P-type)